MGRRKNLPEIDRLNGHPHHGRAADRELPDFGIDATGDVFVPDHLSEDAQACIEVIKASMPPTVYAKVDSFLLAAYATAWAKHKRASHETNAPDFEHVVTSAKGTQQVNPWLQIVNKQALIMASLGDRLGLDPKARAAIRLPSEKPKSKFDGLLGGKAGRGRAAVQ